MGKKHGQTFHQSGYTIADRHTERYSMSLTSKGRQTETKMRYHYTLTTVVKI